MVETHGFFHGWILRILELFLGPELFWVWKGKAEKQKIKGAEKQRSKETEKQENAGKQRSRPAGKSGEAKKHGKAEQLKSRETGNQKSKKKWKSTSSPKNSYPLFFLILWVDRVTLDHSLDTFSFFWQGFMVDHGMCTEIRDPRAEKTEIR